jgi:hypothetical protein
MNPNEDDKEPGEEYKEGYKNEQGNRDRAREGDEQSSDGEGEGK